MVQPADSSPFHGDSNKVPGGANSYPTDPNGYDKAQDIIADINQAVSEYNAGNAGTAGNNIGLILDMVKALPNPPQGAVDNLTDLLNLFEKPHYNVTAQDMNKFLAPAVEALNSYTPSNKG